MGHNRWSPFICLGFAYFLVAVLIPSWLTRGGREPGHWTFSGTLWSLFAGALGCLGSLALIMAFNFGGKPIYVMPLVFGCAPVVNTLVTFLLTRATRPSVVFLLGIVMVAFGRRGRVSIQAGITARLGRSAGDVAGTDGGCQGHGRMRRPVRPTSRLRASIYWGPCWPSPPPRCAGAAMVPPCTRGRLAWRAVGCGPSFAWACPISSWQS